MSSLSAERLYDIAQSIKSDIPRLEEENRFRGWGHGACRVAKTPEGCEIGFYRQAVQNRHNTEVKFFFVTIPLDACGEVQPGQTISSTKGFTGIETEEELEVEARKSFAKLQEMVVEWYNREL